jgi:hypothetical protein
VPSQPLHKKSSFSAIPGPASVLSNARGRLYTAPTRFSADAAGFFLFPAMPTRPTGARRRPASIIHTRRGGPGHPVRPTRHPRRSGQRVAATGGERGRGEWAVAVVGATAHALTRTRRKAHHTTPPFLTRFPSLSLSLPPADKKLRRRLPPLFSVLAKSSPYPEPRK